MRLSAKNIKEFLQTLGLSKREIEVYILLVKSGAQSISFVSKRLKIDRVQTYRTLRRLKEKGLAEATLEKPTRFSVVPLDTLIESYIETKRNEVSNLEDQKDDLINSWKSLSIQKVEYPVAKFSVITGKTKIFSKISKMIEESAREVLILTNNQGVIQGDLAGIFDTAIELARKRDVRFQILANISKQNLKIIREMFEKILRKNISIECHHIDLASQLFPLFVIKDEEEAILYALSGEESSALNVEDEGLWIDDKMFVSVMRAFFADTWRNTIDANERIEELETGIPIGETIVIKDPKEAQIKIANVLDAAQEEIVIITSLHGVSAILQSGVFREQSERGVKCRLMAPIDLDNFEAAKKLSDFCEIKHVAISYMTMLMVGKRHLFIFKTPPLEEFVAESAFYLPDTFYTNDLRYTERVSEMLNDVWKRGVDISELSSKADIKMPTVSVTSSDTVSKLVDEMLKNNVSSALITENSRPIGIVYERDLLKEIVETGKDPRKTAVKEIAYTPLTIIDGGEPMADAQRIMREKGMKRMAVISKGKLVGMLTEEQSKKIHVPLRTRQ